MSKDSPMINMLGSSILSGVGKKVSTVDAFKGKELVLLYFSASWCPPCKAFSPVLIDFYNKIAKEGKLEIVYVSSDRSVESFDEYYGKMPWLAIPTDGTKVKTALAQAFEIQGIPSTILLDVKTGNYIGDNGREKISEVGKTKEACMNLIAEWGSMESVPLDQAAAKRKADAPKQNIFVQMIMHILKNPMYIFGMLYFYKYIKKQFFLQAGGEEAAAVLEEDPMVQDDAMDTEF